MRPASCANLSCKLGCKKVGRDKGKRRCAPGRCNGHCKAAPKPEAAASAPATEKPEAAASAAAFAPATEQDDVGPVHPCPICLVNEDDHGTCALCYACGQLYCGDCNVAERLGRVENCPTCRAPFAVSAEVRIERLLGLVVRSHGRHTPVAQFNLGVMCANGTGVPQNYAEAVRWYRLAADQAHAKGQVNLGVMCEDGTGIPQDPTEAAQWYRRAADQGNAGGQANLGLMYKDGTGVPQDFIEAVRLIKLAADQGHATGQCSLGLLHEDGIGVPQDPTEAARLYRLAADQGLAAGQCSLGLMYQNGTGVSKDFTEAVRWYRLAADQGLATGQLNLGRLFFIGNGVSKDINKAAQLLTLACDQGCQLAIDNLGKLTARFTAGTRVRIVGLVAAAHLNGRLGTAVKPPMQLAAGQIAVRIDGQVTAIPVSWANIGPDVAGGVRQ